MIYATGATGVSQPDPPGLDWEALPMGAIALPPSAIEWATTQSQTVPQASQQWPLYLQALAQQGVEQWLQDRATDLPWQTAACPVMHPAYANLLAAACRSTIEEFTICLVATGSLTDTQISLPRAILEMPDFVAHFYILVQVLEEQGQVHVWGYLRHDQLPPHQPGAGWTCSLPLQAFTLDPEALLLDLRGLTPVALPPALPLDQLQARLADLLPQIETGQTPLQELLSWEEGASILAQPALVNWLYQVQQAGARPSFNPLGALQQLTQQAVNVGLWLRDQFDQATADLAWVLLPELVPAATGLRSTSTALDQLASALIASGITIPQQARGAFRDLRWQNRMLRLYAMTWVMPEAEPSPEWSLLLALGNASGEPLPPGVRFTLQDDWQTLLERCQTGQETYLYGQVVGGWQEQFWVTINLGNGVTATLPPFAFQPEAELPE